MMVDGVRPASEHGLPFALPTSESRAAIRIRLGNPCWNYAGNNSAPPNRPAARNLLDANRTSASPIAKCWPFQDCTDVVPPSHADISERTHAASFTGLQFHSLLAPNRRPRLDSQRTQHPSSIRPTGFRSLLSPACVDRDNSNDPEEQ